MNLECIRNHLRTPAGEKTLKAFAIFSVAILITTALFYAYRKEEREKESVIRITGTETISGLTGDHTTFENGRYHIDADIEIGGEGSLTIQNAVAVFAENHGMNVLTGGTLTIVNSVITSEGTWGGIECSGILNIKGSALLNASTAVAVTSDGSATLTGTTITNSGTALTTSSSPTTTSTILDNCLITANDIGIEAESGPKITTENCRILGNDIDFKLTSTTMLDATDTVLFMNNVSGNGATVNYEIPMYSQTEPQTNIHNFNTNQTTTSLSNGIHALYVKNTTSVTFTEETYSLDASNEFQFIGTFALNDATSPLTLYGINPSALFIRLFDSVGQRVWADLSANNTNDSDSDGLTNYVEWSSDVRWYEAEEFGNVTAGTHTWGNDYSKFDDLVLEPGHWDLYFRVKGSGNLTLFTDENDYDTIVLEDDFRWYKQELNLSTGLLGMLHTETISVDRFVLLPAGTNTTDFSWYRSFDSDADGLSDFAERHEFFEEKRYPGADLVGGESGSWNVTFNGTGNYMVKASGTLYQSVPLGNSIQSLDSIVDTLPWDSTGSLSLLEKNYTESEHNSTLEPELSISTLLNYVNPVSEEVTFDVYVENTGETIATNVTVFAVNRNGSAGGKVLIGNISINSIKSGTLEIEGLSTGTDLTLTAVSNNGGMVTDVLPVASPENLLDFTIGIEQTVGRPWLTISGFVNNGTADRLSYGIDGWWLKTAPVNATTGYFNFTIPNLNNGTHTLLLKATGPEGAIGIHRQEFAVDHWYRGGIEFPEPITGNSVELTISLLNKGGTPMRDTDIFLVSEGGNIPHSQLETDGSGEVTTTLYSNNSYCRVFVYRGSNTVLGLNNSLLRSIPFMKPILEKDIYFGTPSVSVSTNPSPKTTAYAGPADYCELEVDTGSNPARIEVTSNRTEDRIEAPEYTNSSGKATIRVYSDINGTANITVKTGEASDFQHITFDKSRVKIESCYFAKYFTDPNNPPISLNMKNPDETFVRFEVDYLAVLKQGLHPFDADVDGDELPDGVELANEASPWLEDTDNDGRSDKEEVDAGSNPSTKDSDGDGIKDNNETSWDEDTDGDGLINAMDTDSDDDGLPDGVENSDRDGNTGLSDGESDPIDSDTDGDGLPDGWEVKYGLNPINADNPNPDNDLLTNVQEYQHGTNPTSADTDGDGIGDGEEISNGLIPTNADTDGDGIWDGHEINWDDNPDNDATARDPDEEWYLFVDENQNGLWNSDTDTLLDLDFDENGLNATPGNGTLEYSPYINALDPDSDNDGIDDFEGGWWNYDSDGDGLANMIDPDSDNDNLTDGNETNWWVDTDGDGWPNFLDPDSDNDRLYDWEEDVNWNGKVDAGESSPLLVDTDGDGLTDFDEVNGTRGYVTSPAYADSDNDTLSDYDEYQNFTVRYRGIPEIINTTVGGNPTISYWGRILVRTNVNGNYGTGTWIQVDTEWRDGMDALICLGHLEEEPPEGGGSPTRGSRGEGSAQEQWGEHDLVMPDGKPLWIITPYLVAVQVGTDEIEYYGTLEHYPDAVEASEPVVNIYINDGSDIHENQSVTSNPTNNDTDGDKIPDNVERWLGTNPGLNDSDGDGIDDFTEVEVKLRSSGNYTSNLSWIALNMGNGNLTFYQYDDSADFTPAGTEDYSTPEGYPVWLNANASYACVELPNSTKIFYKQSGFQASYPMEGFAEVPMSGTDPLRFDSDGDGLPDGTVEGWEYNLTLRNWANTGTGPMGEQSIGTLPGRYDSDGDRLSDGIEAAGWYYLMNDEWRPAWSTPESLIASPMNPDIDGDGLADGVEYLYTNGTAADTDGDGLEDGKELQVVFRTDANFVEGSGLDYPNSTYVIVKTDSGYENYTYSSSTTGAPAGTYLMPTSDGKKVYLNGTSIDIYDNSTEDGILYLYTYDSDLAERPDPTASFGIKYQELYQANTSPWDIDTDGDMIPDGYIEGWDGHDATGNHNATKDPWEGEDRDLDGIKDLYETDPVDPDTDGDGLPDGKEYFYDAVFPYLNGIESPFYSGNDALFNENVTCLMFDAANGIINPDIDNDGTHNALDTDSDGDGIPDGVEDRNLNGRWDGTVIHKTWSWNSGTTGDTGYLDVNMTDWLVDRTQPMSYKITFKVSNDNDQPYNMPVDTTDIQGNWYNYTVNIPGSIQEEEIILTTNDIYRGGFGTVRAMVQNERTIHSITVERNAPQEIFDRDFDHPFFMAVGETCPYLADSDLDGLSDGQELDLGLLPLDRDFDNDNLFDGYNGHDGGEDRNNDGVLDTDETNVTVPDTDGDGVMDGDEYLLLNYGYADSDGDGIMNLLDNDSDNDGLLDGEENFIRNRFLDLNLTSMHFLESNPYDWDSDDDGLLDGAEPEWQRDSDGDSYINVWDQDSNIGGGETDPSGQIIWVPPGGSEDYNDMYVVFRTNADDSDGDGIKEYTTGTWVAVDTIQIGGATNITTVDLTISGGNPVDGPQLRGFSFVEIVNNQPSADYEIIKTKYGSSYTNLVTPDGKPVFYKNTEPNSGTEHVYIGIEKIDPNTYNLAHYIFGAGGGELSSWSIPHVENGSTPDASVTNFVYLHQETYDPSIALDSDMDGDGLNNTVESEMGTNPYDADSDDDGIIDGDEPLWWMDSDGDDLINAMDPDSDNDGLKDGTEIGETEPSRDTSTGPNFVADTDPTTTTDPLNPDTDGDGVWDGWYDENDNGEWDAGEDGEDMDADGIYEGHIYSSIYELDPLNPDTDFDGLKDGDEYDHGSQPYDADSDEDGIKDGDEVNIYNSYPNNPNSDNDGLLDGLEIGLENGVDGDGTGAGGDDLFYEGTDDGIFVADSDPSTVTSPTLPDTDGDGIPDGVEDSNHNGAYSSSETDPNNPDTDFDGLKDGPDPDPLDADTDDDGISDGDEVFIFGTSPSSPDSDNDTLQDGTELGTTNGIAGKTGWYGGTGPGFQPDVDPSTTTNPTNQDSDGDGIEDGTEDINRNGRFDAGEGNPKYKDSDGDGIPDKVENDNIADSLLHTDGDGIPNIADLDSDGDGLTDHYEYFDGPTEFLLWDTDGDDLADGEINVTFGGDEYWSEGAWGTNPMDEDTDGDWLWDGVEVYGFAGRETNPTEKDTDQDKLQDNLEYTLGTYPDNPDSDGDGIADGYEVFGWTVPVVYFHGDERKDREARMFGNPLWNETKLRDIDEDNIPDWIERNPNSTDPDVPQYIRDYVAMLKEEDDEGNNRTDEIGLIFNPNLRDNLPPDIRNFEVKSEVTYNHHWYGNTVEHCWAEFDADIYDAAGIEYIVMTVEDRGRSETLYQQGDNHYQTCIDISYLRDYLLDYKVAVLAIDRNMNRAEADDTIDGVLVGAVKDLCEKLVDGWNACAEWAIEGLCWIGNYLVNKAMEILQPLLDAVNDGFENFVDGMAKNMYEGYTNAGLIGAFTDVLGYVFTSPLYYSLIAIVVALFVIEIVVKCLTGGSDSLATPVLLPTLITMIKYAIIGKIAEEASDGFNSHGDDVQDFFKGFGIPFGVIGMGLTVYKGIALHNGGGMFLSKTANLGKGDIAGLIFGILGLGLVLYDVVLGTSIDALINMFMDVIGLVFDIKGAYDAYVGKLDLILWVGALCEVTAYISLSVSLISMGLTDYSDAVELLS